MQLAAESRLVLLAVTPSAVLSKWSGESEKTIRSVFAAASAMQPSIVFIVSTCLPYSSQHLPCLPHVPSLPGACPPHRLSPPSPWPVQDEVDAMAGQRSSNCDDASSRRLLTELLLQMTWAGEQDNLYVFACTNRIQVWGVYEGRPRHMTC